MRQLKMVALCAILLLSGCWLFETQRVAIREEVTTLLEAKLGAYSEKTKEAWQKALATELGAQVTAIEVLDGKVTAILPPPVEEAAEKATSSLADKIAANPTPAGVGLGILAMALAAIRVVKRRGQLRK